MCSCGVISCIYMEKYSDGLLWCRLWFCMVWGHKLWCDIVYAYDAVWYLVLWDCGMTWCGDMVSWGFGVWY